MGRIGEGGSAPFHVGEQARQVVQADHQVRVILAVRLLRDVDRAAARRPIQRQRAVVRNSPSDSPPVGYTAPTPDASSLR
eukprot:1522032-Pyramimonas_sp.AAC.2